MYQYTTQTRNAHSLYHSLPVDHQPPQAHLSSPYNPTPFTSFTHLQLQQPQLNTSFLSQAENDFKTVGSLLQFHLNAARRSARRIKKKEKEIRLGSVIFRPSRGDWQCPKKKCRNWNYAKRVSCNVCKSPKEERDEETRGEREEEWQCVGCGFGNYAHKELCFKCSRKRSVSK